MNRLVVVTGLVGALAACAGGRAAPEPVYELRATAEPLRYDLEATQVTEIELPTGGEQEIETATNAVLSLSYGTATAEGLPFVLTFEELEMTMQGAPGGVDLSPAVGEPIRGTVGSSGEISVEEAPRSTRPASIPPGWPR